MAANFNETFLESLSDADLTLMCAFNSTIDPNCLCLLSGGGPEMNTDIGGPGVRISFYLQALFLALLAARSGSLEEISGALYTLIATNVSMAITSLILGFQAQRGISLQDAIVVFYLLAGSWLAIFLSLPSYNRFVKSDTTLQVLTILHSYIVFAFIIAVLITARTFGSTPRCNPHAVGVIFSHFPALPKGRVVALVFACCVTCVYTVLSVVDYYKVFRRRERRRVEKEKREEAREEAKLKNAVAGEEVTDERDTSNPGTIVARTSQLLPPDLERGVVNLGPSISASASSSDATAASSTRGRNPGTRQRNGRKRGAKERHYANSSTSESNQPPTEEQQQAFVTGVQGSLVIEIIVIVVLWMLFVLNTELVIKYNHFNSGEDGDGGDDVWGFGQILPMFLVLLPFVQLVKAFMKWKFGKRDHRTRKHRKPRSLHGHGHGHGHGHHNHHPHHPHHHQHGTGHGHGHGHAHHAPGMGFFPSAFPFFHHATGTATTPLGNQPSARISLNSVHSSLQLGHHQREDRTSSRGSLDLSVVGSPAVAGAPSINSSSSSSSSSSGDDPTGSRSSVKEEDVTEAHCGCPRVD